MQDLIQNGKILTQHGYKMTETVFNTIKHDKNQWMFFGERPNISRYDSPVHPIFDKLTSKQKSFFWQPEEISIDKDSRDFKTLSDAQKNIFTKTISYQSVLDTVQNRSPALALLPHCSLPELEGCIEWWCAMEQMHSHAYTYTIRNVYNNPSEIFDNIILDEHILKRARDTVKYYDDFLNHSLKYRAGFPDIQMRELKRKLLLCVASINALEGLSFYASFACTFAFAEHGLMEGNAKEITLIARDEALHLAITQNILKKWRDGEDDPEMTELYNESIPEIIKIYENVIQQEKTWCKYLFEDGSMIGLNEKILVEYVEHMAGKRLRNLGIKTDYPVKNPLSWMDKYLNSSDVQEAPQETEKTDYIIGGIKNDIEDIDFKDFK